MKKNKGGPIHGQYIDYLFKCFKNDRTYVVREGRLDRKSVDLLIYDLEANKVIGVEIQLTTKHALENIQADVENGCDFVIIACPSATTLRTIKTKVLSSFPQTSTQKVGYIQIVPGGKYLINFSVITRNKARINTFDGE